MRIILPSTRRIRLALLTAALLAVSSCTPGEYQIGSRSFSFPFGDSTPQQAQPIPMQQGGMMPMPVATGPSESFGRGPVKVALLLPLSGDPGTASVGMALANASKLAISFIEANPNIAENITITLRDTGTSIEGATSAASAAVSDGAKLILGPLRADQVTAAGAVARAAGLPLIGFSNNPNAASPGVYLLSVLPDAEMKRSLSYVRSQGRRGIAGIFPNTEFGQAQQAAFRQQASVAGYQPQAVYGFSGAGEVQQVISQALPLIQSGVIDTLFLPDRASAPGFAAALQQAGVAPGRVLLVGSADWQGDMAILQSLSLSGAVYPSVDDGGLNAIAGEYQARFGTQPHPLSTIAYTATILANVNTLSMANPPYSPSLMLAASGFNGRDGIFRFLGNGRSEYGLVIKKLAPGGGVTIDGVKL
ncbi:penicillin-binding protein activator [Devosia neptuniae]|uniref:Penicillin-binding protein activator n=1 Tax=Devosia neptuniae TaxID=191302 RepID=A0ABY6CJI6_9HYPH|nr:penicillin-binding protein activator [Devosia neptuniae]UXN71346.1 penicillin-binding protein activator [Devosia neptuniae]